MAVPKPNPVTTTNLDLNGEKEFVVACKGRPFSILTSPQLPTPPVSYLDLGLCQDLHLHMTDLQCSKLFFGGEKLRILGRISTSVQCIVDGSPLGNIHLKAYVVEDLKRVFNTHAIASEKLHKKFNPSLQLSTSTLTEPTDDDDSNKEIEPKRKKKKKSNKPEKPPPSQPALLSPPRTICQGNWIRYQSYNGWHPEHGYGGPPGVLRDCYRDRRTGQTQGERPDSWDSDGSMHSIESAATPLYSGSSDEYDDDYTNVSTIRHYDENDAAPKNTVVINSAMAAHPPPFLSITEARTALVGNAAAVSTHCPASPNSIIKKMTLNCKRAGMDTATTFFSLQCAGIDTSTAETMKALQCAGMDTNQMRTLQKAKDTDSKDALADTIDPAKNDDSPAMFYTKSTNGKPYTKKDLRHVWKLRREGSEVPLSLMHVPRLHGPDWCYARCAERRSRVPKSCGYHTSWGSVSACSPDCNGGYCDHYQNAEEEAQDYTEQEARMT